MITSYLLGSSLIYASLLAIILSPSWIVFIIEPVGTTAFANMNVLRRIATISAITIGVINDIASFNFDTSCFSLFSIAFFFVCFFFFGFSCVVFSAFSIVLSKVFSSWFSFVSIEKCFEIWAVAVTLPSSIISSVLVGLSIFPTKMLVSNIIVPHIGHSYHSPFLISVSQPHFLHFVII